MTQEEVKAEFTEEQDYDRTQNGESYSGGIGMARGLRFVNRTFPTVNDAEDWLMDNAKKWEAALAVRAEKENMWVIGAWCSS
jgi:hypothetical protein